MEMAFNFSENYVLEDDCVLMRPLQENDYANLLEFALHEPDTWQFSLLTAAGEEGLKAYIHAALNGREEQKEYAFIVFDKKTQQYAGSTRFYDIQLSYQSLQVGYTWYGERFRGTGINKHCKYLLLQFAFEKMGMERVEFRADNNNVRSIAAMKSIGCKVDGILRSNMPTRNSSQRKDSIVLSILKQEWQDEVKASLSKKLKP